MIVVINRASYVEVRDNTKSIFHKNKPSNHGGITGRLLAALGIVESGVFHVSCDEPLRNRVEVLNTLDGRVPAQSDLADETMFEVQMWQKEVNKVM